MISTNPIVLPDYENCNLGIIASIVKYYGGALQTATIPAIDRELDRKRSRNTVWIILDGMGSRTIDKNLPETSWLRRHKKQDLTAIYPCTTTAVMTSFFSGLQPVSHAWLGWTLYFQDWDQCIDVFPFYDTFTGTPLSYEQRDILKFMDVPSVFETISRAADRQLSIDLFITHTARKRVMELATPGYTKVDSLENMVAQVKAKCAEAGDHFIVAYWKEPDSIMHPYGITSEKTRSFFETTDALFERMIPELCDATVIMSADHGLTDMDSHLPLDEMPELIELMRNAPGGDGRCKALYVKPGKEDLFAARFERRIPREQYHLKHSSELIANGLFGITEIHPRTPGFLGDFVALAVGQSDLTYTAPNGIPAKQFIGHHAGLTADEMIVPLILA